MILAMLTCEQDLDSLEPLCSLCTMQKHECGFTPEAYLYVCVCMYMNFSGDILSPMRSEVELLVFFFNLCPYKVYPFLKFHLAQ